MPEDAPPLLESGEVVTRMTCMFVHVQLTPLLDESCTLQISSLIKLNLHALIVTRLRCVEPGLVSQSAGFASPRTYRI